jgi:hypothetical protein
MTRFADAFGKKYEENKEKIFTRKFELGGHTFRVRVPYVHESDEIYKRIQEPSTEAIEKEYKTITDPLMAFKDNPANESVFVFTDDDVIVEGRSLRESAKTKVQTQIKITEFFKLLIPEVPDHSLVDLTYEEIEAEFPMSVQSQMIEKIVEAISPTYKEARGN